jgi:hypothetical protein
VIGAHQKCQSAADAAGLGTGRTFIALLADGQFSALTQIQSSRGWLRSDGTAVTDLPDDFASGLRNAVTLDERGEPLRDQFEAWTGIIAEGGGSSLHCRGFTSASGDDEGSVGSLIDRELFTDSTESCDTDRRLLCLSVGMQEPIKILSPTGKRFFASGAAISPYLGAADDLCKSEATDAGLVSDTEFVAFLPIGDKPAIDRIRDPNVDYFLMDGTNIGKLNNSRPSTFLGLTAKSKVRSGDIWTGGAPGETPTNPTVQSCSGWQNTGSVYTGTVGRASRALGFAFDYQMTFCSEPHSVYCVEG